MVKYLPILLQDVAAKLEIDHALQSSTKTDLLSIGPGESLELLSDLYGLFEKEHGQSMETTEVFISAYTSSDWSLTRIGMHRMITQLGSEPVIIVPETHHYSLPKHADVMGLGRQSLLTIPVDSRFRMRADELEKALDEVDSSGRHVLAVVAVVGTTEEGAVDPIHEIVQLRESRSKAGKPSFWLHADAAFGGAISGPRSCLNARGWALAQRP